MRFFQCMQSVILTGRTKRNACSYSPVSLANYALTAALCCPVVDRLPPCAPSTLVRPSGRWWPCRPICCCSPDSAVLPVRAGSWRFSAIRPLNAGFAVDANICSRRTRTSVALCFQLLWLSPELLLTSCLCALAWLAGLPTCCIKCFRGC